MVALGEASYHIRSSVTLRPAYCKEAQASRVAREMPNQLPTVPDSPSDVRYLKMMTSGSSLVV